MKIKIGPYRSWFGPYQLAEALCFWVKAVPDKDGIKSKPYWVHSFGDLLAHGQFIPEPKIGEISSWASEELPQTWLYKFLSWIDSKKTRKVKIHLDRYDTWSMEHTLALIIVPMLKQLQATKHGAPFVDDEDVPESMRLTVREDWSEQLQLDLSMSETEREKYEKESWDIVHVRWKWVLEQIIWSFEQLHPDSDWESQFHSGNSDIVWAPSDMLDAEGEPLAYTMDRGPKDTHKFDIKGYMAHSERINLGLKLFGKYYRGLWS